MEEQKQDVGLHGLPVNRCRNLMRTHTRSTYSKKLQPRAQVVLQGDDSGKKGPKEKSKFSATCGYGSKVGAVG